MYKRPQYKILIDRLAEPRRFIQAIVGPRQIGKTTMVREVSREIQVPHLLVSADSVDPGDTDWIHSTWETARSIMRVSEYSDFVLIIDEIHKINNWSSHVKAEWDDDTYNNISLKVVILGSSRLLMKSGLNESLAGRFELIRMGHWSYKEMKEAFGWSLDEYIYFGGYPGSAVMISDEKRWKRYIRDAIVAPSIEKDVLITKVVYKPELMHRLFEIGCEYSGKELSLNKILVQIQDAGNVTTLSEYLKTLSEANLLTGLYKYANDSARKYNSIPKFIVSNNALLTTMSPKKYEDVRVDPALWGRWVESAVGAHLLASADEEDYKVYYWRERDKEVDFVIQGNGKTVAIEVKSGRKSSSTGLAEFRKKFGVDRTIIVGTDGIPVDEFLSASPNLLLQ